MATLDDTVMTLPNWAKRLDPDQKAATVVEMLHQNNSILDDMLWMESNKPTSHLITQRIGLSKAYWRALNRGVPASSTKTAQVEEAMGILEDWSLVDKDLAELNGNTNAFRLTEAEGHIEGISQEMASTLFYGNQATDSKEFNGLAIRYASSGTSGSGQNVIKVGGSRANMQSSAWVVCWGANKICGIFPKGSKAGVEHEDLGLDTVNETEVGAAGGVSTRQFRAYRDRWVWKAGLAVKDWRYAVRLANIDVTKGTKDNLGKPLIRAINRLPNAGMSMARIYMNRSVFTQLEEERYDRMTGATVTWREVDGMSIPIFRGIPIKIVDAITNTEGLVP